MSGKVEPSIFEEVIYFRVFCKKATLGLFGVPTRSFHLLESRLTRLVIRDLCFEFPVVFDFEDVWALDCPFEEVFAIVGQRVIILNDCIRRGDVGLGYCYLFILFLFGVGFLIIWGFWLFCY